MRAVAQRVLEANVTVDKELVSKMGRGLLVLLGVGQADQEDDARWMADKLANLRVFEDAAGKMNRSLLDTTREMIAVSQFTLYGDCRKGRRPSFIAAKEPVEAKRLYELFCAQAVALGLEVGMGVFAADMKVALVNDGPVTLLLDSADRAAQLSSL